jgi:hypothetical protein
MLWVCCVNPFGRHLISHPDGAARNLLQLSESLWVAVEETFSSSLLWTSLYCGEQPPTDDSECFGFEQPIVRRTAWNLLLSVLEERKGKGNRTTAVLALTDCRRRTPCLPSNSERLCPEICLGGTGRGSPHHHVAAFTQVHHRYVILFSHGFFSPLP